MIIPIPLISSLTINSDICIDEKTSCPPENCRLGGGIKMVILESSKFETATNLRHAYININSKIHAIFKMLSFILQINYKYIGTYLIQNACTV